MGKRNVIQNGWGQGLPGSSGPALGGYQPAQALPDWATPNNISEDAIRRNDGDDSNYGGFGGLFGKFDWGSIIASFVPPEGVKYNPREALPDWASPDYVPQQRAPVPQQAPSAQAPPAQRLSGRTEYITAMIEAMANTPHSQQTEVSRALRATPAASEGE